MRKLEYIDALRGLAIIGVLMIHSQYGPTNVPFYLRLTIEQGGRGVQLFYLASAFTLFLSFQNRVKKEVSPIRNFFIRRFFRIAPMYYLGICYYLIQDGFGPRYFLGNETHISTLNVLSNLTFLHGFNPYWINSLVPGGWSIAVEMTFYIILPFLFARIKNISQALWFLNISLIVRLLLQIALLKFPLIDDSRLWSEYLFFYFPNQLPIFALGIIMYYLVSEEQTINKISGKPTFVFCIIYLTKLITGNDVVMPFHIFFGTAFLILGVALSKFNFKLIVNPIVQHIGKISFSMYLVHFFVIHWLTNLNFIEYSSNGLLNYVVRFSLVTCITVLISSILYRLIEIPFQKIGKKIIDKLELKNSTCKIS